MPRKSLNKAGRKKPLISFTPEKREKLAPLATNANEPRFTPEEAAKMAEPHAPECFLVCCIDSRFQPAKALDYGPGVALEYRPIACVIPPEKDADPGFLSRMAFRRLNGIRNITLVTHSDCGGAKAALKVPEPDIASGDDLHIVAAVVHRSGPDVSRIGQEILAEEKGDLNRAGDRLAREIGVTSLNNLLAYKGNNGHATIADEIAAGELNVMLLFYDLADRKFQIYEPGKKEWRDASNDEARLLKAAPAQHTCTHHHHHGPKGLKK